ncbi:MAG: dTDP-4-dehydrorhamnose reductase [Candidatus Margulisiibacteriota bacterium]
MKVILAGADGMLGSDMLDLLNTEDIDVKALYYPDFDYARPESVTKALQSEDFDVLINCTAYTRVDDCESNRKEAMLVNADGPKMLADICRDKSALLVHFSTDYVFDGLKAEPYVESDLTGPINEYGRTKLEGEKRIIKSGVCHLIIRTSWLYGPNGPNFVESMLKLGKTRSEVKVVNDQFGSPTYTKDLAQKSWEVINTGIEGITHINNQGYCTWAEFAQEIFAIAGIPVIVNKCRTEEYPTPAKRQKNSRLQNQRLIDEKIPLLRSWQDALREYITKDE